MKEATKEWIDESVSYFKAMGFLEDGFDLEKIHEYVRDVYFDEYFERQPRPTGWFELDMQLLAQDHRRVWWQDLEISHSTQEAYLEAIQKWSAVSRGHFVPQDLQVKWIDLKEYFEIAFTADGKPFTYRSDLTGWISPDLIDEINALLVDSGVLLYQCNTRDQSAFVVALTKDEKSKLEKERGWECFCAYDQ
jgi:hypothetical protein